LLLNFTEDIFAILCVNINIEENFKTVKLKSHKQNVMVNKKHLLLVGLCSALVAQPAFAQESQSAMPASSAQWSARDMTYRGQNYDVLDTAYVPKRSMAQHKKFLNHQSAFPARPRNMWEVGFGIGQPDIIGSIPGLLFYQAKGGTGGFNVNVRKSWAYMFSTRIQYIYSVAKGLDYRSVPADLTGNSSFSNNGYLPTDRAYPNYRVESHQLSLDLMLNTNNIKFNRARTSVSFYGYLGLGVVAYKTYLDVKDGSGKTYAALFQTVYAQHGSSSTNKNATRTDLQNGMDGVYETAADNRGGSSTSIFGGVNKKILDFAPSVGAGAQFRLSKRVNLQLEERLTYPNGDGEYTGNNFLVNNSNQVPTRASDLISYTSIGLNFNLGNRKKRIEPLYWVNPLDFAYNELSYPRHMLLPEPVLPDADGDGVTDQFDKCPGTPAGVSVDAHGCPMDTDGDGVPDFRDKQLITPTECQPVDADGVGKCPCPEGCGTGNKGSQCGNIGAGSIIFPTTSAKISSAMQSQLATLAAQMQSNPDCHVVITGAGNGNKLQQQRSWDRVNSVIQYMSEKNSINRNRFIFQYGQSGDANVVMYRSANVGEEGPVNVPPPFPNLKTGENK
jgi:OOP family OmpA-OmpF porin